jgi:hypothetical protein
MKQDRFLSFNVNANQTWKGGFLNLQRLPIKQARFLNVKEINLKIYNHYQNTRLTVKSRS